MSPGTSSLALILCTVRLFLRITLAISGSYSFNASIALSAFRSYTITAAATASCLHDCRGLVRRSGSTRTVILRRQQEAATTYTSPFSWPVILHVFEICFLFLTKKTFSRKCHKMSWLSSPVLGQHSHNFELPISRHNLSDSVDCLSTDTQNLSLFPIISFLTVFGF